MAICFGEVEEKTSRAFWDEDDDFDDDVHNNCFPDRLYKTEWMTNKNVLQYKFDVLIVVEGAFVKGVFEQGVIAKAEPVAKIIDLNCTSKAEHCVQKSDVACKIFLLGDANQKALICICEANLDMTKTFFFAKELLPLMSLSKKVVMLTSCSASSYFHHEKTELPISFLRRLQTDTYRGELVCERLEQPNIVSGISAQVLSWCQVHQLPAGLFVCYSETDEIDSETTKPIVQLLSKLNFANLQIGRRVECLQATVKFVWIINFTSSTRASQIIENFVAPGHGEHFQQAAGGKKVQADSVVPLPIAVSTEAAQQFELELCWCIQQLEVALSSNKLNAKQAKETSRALSILKSNTSSIVKKRQVMNITFGDYRAKMLAEEKKAEKASFRVKFDSKLTCEKSRFVNQCSSKLFETSNKNFRFNFASEEDNEGQTSSAHSENNRQPQFKYKSSDNSFRFKFDDDEMESSAT